MHVCVWAIACVFAAAVCLHVLPSDLLAAVPLSTVPKELKETWICQGGCVGDPALTVPYVSPQVPQGDAWAGEQGSWVVAARP